MAEQKYDVFVRRAFRDSNGPDSWQGLEPHWGRKYYLAQGVTLEVAKKMCKEYNATHKPGPYHKMAEFTRD